MVNSDSGKHSSRFGPFIEWRCLPDKEMNSSGISVRWPNQYEYRFRARQEAIQTHSWPIFWTEKKNEPLFFSPLILGKDSWNTLSRIQMCTPRTCRRSSTPSDSLDWKHVCVPHEDEAGVLLLHFRSTDCVIPLSPSDRIIWSVMNNLLNPRCILFLVLVQLFSCRLLCDTSLLKKKRYCSDEGFYASADLSARRHK